MKGSLILSIVTFILIPLHIYCQTPGQITNQQQKRIALIIGNGNYIAGPLANPENDARAMKAALQNVGFEVTKYENLTQGQMKKAIDEFGDKLKAYDVGLFYYAGHGIQSKGNNYLIPVDAQLTTEKQVEYDCVQADRILALMDGSVTKVNIIILDACRNNPFERSWTRSATGKGLAFMDAPTGTLIAYATSPGKTASDGSGINGLYTSAILESIQISDITILQMFQNVRNIVVQKSNNQQIPWESTSLIGDFYFSRSIVSYKNVPVIGDIKETITYGKIELTSEISGELYLDDNKIYTLKSNTLVSIDSVATGDHIIKISGPENWLKNITVNKDQTTSIHAKKDLDYIIKSANRNEFTDYRDGRKYSWVKIGDQIWMAENLAYLPRVNAPFVGSKTDPYYYVYGYNGDDVDSARATKNYIIYGTLYNWPAAMNGSLSSNLNPSGVKGICPNGWHLPSDAEWKELSEYLGGQRISGSKLKETGFDHWYDPNTSAANSSGFTALPGGIRFNNEFLYLGLYGLWWSSSGNFERYTWTRILSNKNGKLRRGRYDGGHGYSIRCVRDK
ncbi:MAG: caspase family protein [Bacteroidales bacterium]|nr:caspase family protein [Bacteroidales bacterium]